MRYRIHIEARLPNEKDPNEGYFTLIANDTIITGGTKDDQVLTYMIDNHTGVAPAILNCRGKATQIRLYYDLSTPSGVRGTIEPMSHRYYQFGQIDLFPNPERDF